MNTEAEPGSGLSYQLAMTRLAVWEKAHQGELRDEGLALQETKRRLVRLQSVLKHLVTINTELMLTQMGRMQFDPTTQSLVPRPPGPRDSRIHFDKAAMDLPFKQIGSATTAVFQPGGWLPHNSTRSHALTLQLEDYSEAYYYNAHRVLKQIQGLPHCKRFKSIEITMVRNKLIEHADHNMIYTLGFGAHGPVIRPLGKIDELGWKDAGLFPNTQAFISALEAIFELPVEGRPPTDHQPSRAQ